MTHVQIATAVALIVGYAAAHAAGFLTSRHAPIWVTGVVAHGLAVVAGIVPTVVWDQHDSWQKYVVNVFAAISTATLAHLTGAPTAIKHSTPGVAGKRRHNDAGSLALLPLVVVVVIIAIVLGILVHPLFLLLCLVVLLLL